jgi:hypothetical protein
MWLSCNLHKSPSENVIYHYINTSKFPCIGWPIIKWKLKNNNSIYNWILIIINIYEYEIFYMPQTSVIKQLVTKNTTWHGSHKFLWLQSILSSIAMDEYEYDVGPI